jgi:hypothetical protein
MALFVIVSMPIKAYAFDSGYFDTHTRNVDYTVTNYANGAVNTIWGNIIDNDDTVDKYISSSYPIEAHLTVPKFIEKAYIKSATHPLPMVYFYFTDGTYYKTTGLGGVVDLVALDSRFTSLKVAYWKIPGNSYVSEMEIYEPATPVSIVSVTPANGRTDVNINDYVMITFDQNVVDSGTVQIDGVITTKIVLNNTIKLIPATALTYDTTYNVTVSGVRSVQGGYLTNAFTSTFKTDIDRSNLSVDYIKPPPSSTNIPLNQDIEIKFNKTIDLTTVGNVRVQEGNNIVPTNMVINNDKINMTFLSSLSPNTNYKIYIDGVKDTWGNGLASPIVVDFTTTVQVNTLSLVSYKPPSGIVPYGQQFEFEFDKNVDPASLVYEFKDSKGNIVPCTTNVVGTKVTITPSLTYGETYDFKFVSAKTTSGVFSPINLNLQFSVMKSSGHPTIDSISVKLLNGFSEFKSNIVTIILAGIAVFVLYKGSEWLYNKLKIWLKKS